MAKFICVRCGYSTDIKSHIKDHLKKNKVCTRLFIEIDREKILEMLENSNEYIKYLDPLRPLFKELYPESVRKHTIKNVIPNDEFDVIPKQNSMGLDKKEVLHSSTRFIHNINSKPIESSSEHICTRCGRNFNNRQNRWKHEKICRYEPQNATNIVDNTNINSHNTTNINSNNTPGDFFKRHPDGSWQENGATSLITCQIYLNSLGVEQGGSTTFYKDDGSIRQFGVGYRNKTILPVWLLAIILGILSYLFVLYYLAYPRISFV